MKAELPDTTIDRRDDEMQTSIDHLIVAGPTLEAAVDHVREMLGVEPSPGGVHPGVGTRNALVGLGPGVYLEVIGPDPDQPEPALPRWFGIDGLAAPALVTWSARTEDIDAARSSMVRAGVDPGAISSGGRVRPDGTRLAWRVTDPRADRLAGVLPFLMDWGDSAHPSGGLADGLELLRLCLFHPRIETVRAVADALALPVELASREHPGIEADIRTPSGRVVTLR